MAEDQRCAQTVREGRPGGRSSRVAPISTSPADCQHRPRSPLQGCITSKRIRQTRSGRLSPAGWTHSCEAPSVTLDWRKLADAHGRFHRLSMGLDMAAPATDASIVYRWKRDRAVLGLAFNAFS